MRYTIILLALIFIACHKPEPMAIPAPPVGNWGFVPTWRADTMINGYRLGADTMYSWRNGDTTGVLYGGDTLYVFGVFDTTKASSLEAWIGPDYLDSTTAYSKCFVGYYRYWSINDNKQKYAPQMLTIITRDPNFNTTGDAYYLGRP